MKNSHKLKMIAAYMVERKKDLEALIIYEQDENRANWMLGQIEAFKEIKKLIGRKINAQ